MILFTPKAQKENWSFEWEKKPMNNEMFCYYFSCINTHCDFPCFTTLTRIVMGLCRRQRLLQLLSSGEQLSSLKAKASFTVRK